jgi:hypothetical protein
MSALSDEDMSNVAGRDGLAVSIDGDITAQSLQIQSDIGTVREAGIIAEDIVLGGTGAGEFNADLTFDTTNVGGVPRPVIGASWENIEMRTGDIRHTSALGNSYGEAYLSSGSGSFLISAENGLFNNGSNQGYLSLRSTGGDIILRQGGPGSAEVSFGNFNITAETQDGAGNLGPATMGIDADGLLIDAPFLEFALNFDLLFKANPTDFDTTGRDALILFGWEGGVTDAKLRLGTGGIGYGTAVGPSGFQEFNYDGSLLGTRSEGLNLSVEWNYDTDFAWILGQAAGNRTRARFFDWQRMPGASIDFSMPIIVDAINGAGQGPGNICFGGDLPTSGSLNATGCGAVGGSLIALPPDAPGLAVIIRDGRLHAYNSQVEVIDPGTAVPSEIFNWSLVYTFGKLDSNIYLYPSGFGGGNTGIRADVALAIQSPGYWDAAATNFSGITGAQIGDPAFDPRARWATNTHFLIADTATATAIPTGSGPSNRFGIGLVNADLIWKVDDFFLRIVDSDPDYAGIPGGLWLQSDTEATYRFRGLFGGGSLDDMSDPVRISLLDINLATNGFLFALSGAPGGQSYIGYDGLLNFDGTAYVSLAEPSSPSADFRLDNVSGNIAWRNGRVLLESAATTADNKPALTLQNDLQFGSTAGLGGSTPFQGDPLIGEVSFSGKTLGQVAIPSGQWYSSISLKKQ